MVLKSYTCNGIMLISVQDIIKYAKIDESAERIANLIKTEISNNRIFSHENEFYATLDAAIFITVIKGTALDSSEKKILISWLDETIDFATKKQQAQTIIDITISEFQKTFQTVFKKEIDQIEKENKKTNKKKEAMLNFIKESKTCSKSQIAIRFNQTRTDIRSKAIQELLDENRIIEIEQKTSGRPTTMYSAKDGIL